MNTKVHRSVLALQEEILVLVLEVISIDNDSEYTSNILTCYGSESFLSHTYMYDLIHKITSSGLHYVCYQRKH